ncbi:MAG: DUF1844 domain-containing protein [Candidatus Deferrimicrobium sp.]
MPEEKDDKGFKVIDRRGMEPPSPPPAEKTASGATAGQGPPSQGEAPPKPGNQPPPPGVEGNEVRGEEGKSPLGVPRFLDLVQSLQMGAMVGLGMLQGPDGKRPPVDLPAAKDAIDLLGILQEKTKGNLTKEEEEILREGLYHLRMGYMAMINPPPAGRGKEGNQR